MRQELLGLVCCPACRGELAREGAVEERDGEIWTATLRCHDCGAVYPVAAGMPRLYVDDERWQPKATEAAGWIELHKQKGIYVQPEDAVDLLIPYCLEGMWRYVGESFNTALGILALSGKERVLDLGAMRGWASKNFAQMGCDVVAIDIVADDQVGLGRAKTIMEHGYTYFERVIGDGENLPFKDGQFDLVFCNATLHHFSHLDLLLSNVRRVLRPGGRFFAMNEPCISFLEREVHMLAAHSQEEIDVGINETRPYFRDYLEAVEAAGLEVEVAMPVVGYRQSVAELRRRAVDAGAVRPSLSLRRPKEILWRTRHLLTWRLRAWRNSGRLLGIPRATDDREALGRALLDWESGDMYLLARRPAEG